MSDPKRLIDGGGDDFEVSLLRSAAADAPASRARHKALVAMGLATGLGAVSAKATAAAGVSAAARVTALSVVKWVGIGMIGGAATIGMVETVAPSRSSTVLVSKPVAPDAPSPLREAVPAAVPAPIAAASDSALPAVTEPVRAPLAPPSAPPSSTVQSSLADEVRALDRAREALAQGNPGLAFTALNDYQREFPKGSLQPEALVLRIETMAASGDQSGARALGGQFLHMHPDSPHASRIRSLTGLPSIP